MYGGSGVKTSTTELESHAIIAMQNGSATMVAIRSPRVTLAAPRQTVEASGVASSGSLLSPLDEYTNHLDRRNHDLGQTNLSAALSWESKGQYTHLRQSKHLAHRTPLPS
jgi:hypothetical protein